jgi:O-antigen ligase
MWGRAFYETRIAGLFDITIERALFVIVAASLIVGLFSEQSSTDQNRTIAGLFFLFSLICLASMGIHGFRQSEPKYVAPFYFYITAYLFPFVAFVFAKRFLTTERALSFFLHTLFYFGVYLAVIAFFEFFGLRQYVYPEFINDPKVLLHLDRARGPFLNSAINGLALIVGFICGMHLFSFKQGFGKIFHLAMLSLFFPAVFFTLTRSIYLCFLFVLAMSLFAYRTSFPKWKTFALPMCLVCVLAFSFTPRLSSSERRAGGIGQIEEILIREALLKRSIVMIADNPVLGVGLGQFIPASVAKYKGVVPIPETSEEQTQHNQLIGMTVELGFVGVLVYLAILIVFFRRFFALYSRLPWTGLINSNLALLLGLCASVFLINNLFVDASFHLFPNVLFFTCGGIADGLYGQLEFMQTSKEEMTAPSLSSSNRVWA